jgi:hypothetical protein
MRKWANQRERHRVTYQFQRALLVALLGGKCNWCGTDDVDKLEFHHTRERTWVARKCNRWTRLKRYREEAAAGQCVIACRSCNAKMGPPPAVSIDEAGNPVAGTLSDGAEIPY